MILNVTTVDANGEPVPTGFKLGTATLAVLEIVDRWPGEHYSYFKVRADDEAVYILRHDKIAAEWELTLFSRNGINN